MKKLNLSNKDIVREKVSQGVKEMNDLVSLTLGPEGTSVMISRPNGEPLLVDDGRRVAENVKLDDPIKQDAARVCYSVTRKTDEKVGDGTTTSMVLANAILQNNLLYGAGTHFNVAETDRKIQQSKIEVLKKLDSMKTEIKSEKELIEVSTVISGDKDLGKMIGSMQWQLGPLGHISIEFNLTSEKIETEIADGYRFEGGNATMLVTDDLRKNIIERDVNVFVINQKILDFADIVPAINLASAKGKNRIVIIAQKFEDGVIKEIHKLATRERSPFFVWAIKAPGRGEEAFKDMAVISGAKYFGRNDVATSVQYEDLGHLGKFEFEDDVCYMIEGKGTKEAITKRIKEVEEEVKQAKVHAIKKDKLERLSALSKGYGVIKIGAPTNEERNWLKYKIEDAREATKHALRDGVVQGGGYAFKKISESLPDGDVLKKALLAPYETLVKNLGHEFKPTKDILDPVTVEKVALENACSAVGKLIRIGGAIAYKPESMVEQLKNVINNNNEDESYEE